MSNSPTLPVGLRRWPKKPLAAPQQVEGFEVALLDNCDNAYRFTAMVDVSKVAAIISTFSRFMSDEAFFILEYYPEDSIALRPSDATEQPMPVVFYSPYLPTSELLEIIRPYLDRLTHDGFVGFGLANNRKGLELFYSEEKVMTFLPTTTCDFQTFFTSTKCPTVRT